MTEHRSRSRLPQEVWDKISSHLLGLPAFEATEAFGYQPEAHDRIWGRIFKSDEWLLKALDYGANPVLIGADLEVLGGSKKSSRRPRLFLTAGDYTGDLQYENQLLKKCLRGTCNELTETSWDSPDVLPGTLLDLEHASLTVDTFTLMECYGEDFRYLFSNGRRRPLETKYCYYKDEEKKVRTLTSEDIRGMDGQATRAKQLSPIFLLHLTNPTQRSPGIPEQYIFRNFVGISHRAGMPPLVSPILRGKMDNGEYLFNGFVFQDRRLRCRRKTVDWNKVVKSLERRHM